MKHISVNKSKTNPIWMGVLVGIILALLISLVGAVLSAFLINEGNIGENAYWGISSIVWFLASFLGTASASKAASQQCIIVSAITALGYLLIIAAIQILFFDSQFGSIWKAMLIVAAGLLPTILIFCRPEGKKKAKIKYRKL